MRALRLSGEISGGAEPVLRRLQASGALGPEVVDRVRATASRVEAHPARAILQIQDDGVRRPRYLVSGWACRFRDLPDGRRQIFDLVLPGEGVGVCLRPNPLANTSTLALTAVRLIDASPLLDPQTLSNHPGLLGALHAQADAGERRALDQILRLGRMSALERLAHLLVELHERLEQIGHVDGDSFAFPLTQDMVADLTGLSVVHVNRTVQQLRRRNLVQIERGVVSFPDLAAIKDVFGDALSSSARAA